MIAETANLASGFAVVKEEPDVQVSTKAKSILAWGFSGADASGCEVKGRNPGQSLLIKAVVSVLAKDVERNLPGTKRVAPVSNVETVLEAAVTIGFRPTSQGGC